MCGTLFSRSDRTAGYGLVPGEIGRAFRPLPCCWINAKTEPAVGDLAWEEGDMVNNPLGRTGPSGLRQWERRIGKTKRGFLWFWVLGKGLGWADHDLDIRELIAEREAERYQLHSSYLNEQMVHVLKTIGFDRRYQRGVGQYLYDGTARNISTFERLGCVRDRDAIIRRCARPSKAVLEANCPIWCRWTFRVLAGHSGGAVAAFVPISTRCFSPIRAAEAVEAAIKFARAATRRPGIVYCSHAFHGLTNGSLSLNGDRISGRVSALSSRMPRGPVQRSRGIGGASASARSPPSSSSRFREKASSFRTTAISRARLRLCRKYGTLFVADEIQTGLGRTGRFLAASTGASSLTWCCSPNRCPADTCRSARS